MAYGNKERSNLNLKGSKEGTASEVFWRLGYSGSNYNKGFDAALPLFVYLFEKEILCVNKQLIAVLSNLYILID